MLSKNQQLFSGYFFYKDDRKVHEIVYKGTTKIANTQVLGRFFRPY